MKQWFNFFSIFLVFVVTHLHGSEEMPEQYAQTTPVHEAVRRSDLGRVKALHARGVDLTASDEKGRMPLHLAAMVGHMPIVEFLVQNGSAEGADWEDKNEYTPFHEAVKAGHREVVSYLFGVGATIRAQDDRGEAALHMAAQRGHSVIVQDLLAFGAPIDQRDMSGRTPLLSLTFRNPCHAEQVAGILISAGADVNARDYSLNTPLHFAVVHGNESFVRVLLSKGASLNLRNIDGDLPLHRAVVGGRNALIVELLVNAGAEVNALGHDQFSPLQLAVLRENLNTICFLLEHGADPFLKGHQGGTALHEAVIGGHDKIVSIFLQLGADIDAVDADGWTSLHVAADSGHHEMIRVLAKQGADVCAETDDGETPLMLLLKHVHCNREDKENHKKGADVLLRFGITVSDDELRLLKKHYPEYCSWVYEKKAHLKQQLQQTMVAELSWDLQNLIIIFVLSNLPPASKRGAGVEIKDPRPAKKNKPS